MPNDQVDFYSTKDGVFILPGFSKASLFLESFRLSHGNYTKNEINYLQVFIVVFRRVDYEHEDWGWTSDAHGKSTVHTQKKVESHIHTVCG